MIRAQEGRLHPKGTTVGGRGAVGRSGARANQVLSAGRLRNLGNSALAPERGRSQARPSH